MQDLRPSELSLILAAVGMRVENLTLSGDTAQQITPGVVFRFGDVRTVVHRLTIHSFLCVPLAHNEFRRAAGRAWTAAEREL